MGKMIVWELIASAFFSTSFVLYQLMSVQGGHWFWSASFRCFFISRCRKTTDFRRWI
ncbi:hypothetical protein [Moraxella osloensis]|uniref:hypothetical protein n=1 Tax=Faucicola osloensis TaxID=34062 RepID=UPI00242A4347|nr:hypothetical protein [Moraxella osloensis]